MARGRLISKSLGSSRKFHALLRAGGKIGEFCQILFPLLVANSDDFGRLPGDAFTVKNVVLPSSKRPERDFDKALDIIADVGLIDRYQIDGVVCVQIAQFDEHQAGLHKRTKSRIPESPGISGKFRTNLTEFKGTELKGIQGKRTEQNQNSGAENAPRTPAENVKVITVVVHDLLKLGNIPDDELSEAVKSQCASLKIAYDSVAVGKAIDSAREQRKRKAG